MAHLTGYGAYVAFVTVRTHFESKTFDFFTHHRVKANRRTYENRSDRWFFDKVAKEYKDRELFDFFIANRLESRNYVTELLEDEAKENYIKYTARRQSLSYLFANEVDRVFKHGCKYAFDNIDGQYPYVVGLYLRKVISPETMVILDNYVPFFNKFNKYLGDDDPIWSKVELKLRKYKPFLKYDKDKFKVILKSQIKERKS